MRISVIVFPGTNCDHDIVHLYGSLLGQEVTEIWHRESDLQRPDVVVLPGGFSYGDYLRTGALAKVSPVMEAIRRFAAQGGPVIGICNGFQILCEAGLLPGALLQNVTRKFISRFVHMRVETTETPFTRKLSEGRVVTCPIAHFDGCYFAEDAVIAELEDRGQVVFRYCDPNGNSSFEDLKSNVNGSVHAIAGICNPKRNVVGLMPHPERAVEGLTGSIGGTSGLEIFSGLLA